ncbi:glucuronate isomerase [Salinibacterium sp. PAMC 21357]|uniref:glucuronate isomerase n=1 Tax=Salinibacterium sp. PAMC 21357 TaxID=1112215 RepID=UPI000288A2FB|nr:glucuronate isomerase [Salinibacterium sp. PAMC 21357]
MTILLPHPDRLFSSNPEERDIARRLYSEVQHAPIYSPHGHVEAAMLLADEPFADPAALLITPDHYVTRLLHANGVSLNKLGLAQHGIPSDHSGREIWRRFSENWNLFQGTPVMAWFETELSDVFGVAETPSSENSDAIYDQLSAAIATPAMRPRALFDRFGIRVLATTDDPADDLAAHAALAADPTFAGHVLPTLRADVYMNPLGPQWAAKLASLSAAANIDCGSYAGLLSALRSRREYFIAHGATATDTGVVDAGAEPLSPEAAERLHAAGLAGTLTAGDAVAYRHNMLYQFAAMSVDDGLVMQLHAGVIRNHHKPTFDSYGPDTGHDLPDRVSFTRPLEPLLRDFGTAPGFHLVLFTVDESAFSREIAPLAGFYPAVFAGAPWWFLDSPAAMRRYREAVTETAGFTKTSGFIDDTRAFCSIPARHDMSRRVDAAYLASLVAQHQITEESALEIAVALVSTRPIDTFRLPA